MKRLLVLLLLLISLVSTSVVLSAPNSLTMTWWTVDGGGTSPELSGGSYSLRGTTGQADAGMHNSNGYTLYGGYWNPTTSNSSYIIYIPIIQSP